MGDAAQPGWTRVFARTGRYEYQFQGRVPAVRNGRYEDASDFQFLVMDEEGWLYKIPVRLAAAAEAELESHLKAQAASAPESKGESAGWTPAATPPGIAVASRIAEAQLRAGLENFRPRQNTPYAELDRFFAIDVARARELAAGKD